MAAEKPLAINYSQREATLQFVQRPLIHSSQQAGWKNIHLAHYQLPAGEIPEISSLQHTICLTSSKQSTEVELAVGGKPQQVQHDQSETGCIEILPAYLPIRVSSRHSSAITYTLSRFFNLSRCEVDEISKKSVKNSIKHPF